MSARDTLTPELRAEVLRLEDDLRTRVASLPEVQSAWRAEYDAARAAERTAAAWEAWVDERVTLAAVAWVLTTVFVRFCEDNGLVKPVWISGPRGREAIEAQQQFLRETARTNADVTDREWLLQGVEHLKSLPATAGLVDDTSPMWLVTPSGDAATRLLSFWRDRHEEGALIRDLSDPDLDTRFLGDLYQDISEDAKKRYALLQTPVFVEEFILDRTLEPALNERPLEDFKMIDPTCGSGHFLLGGFQRLLDRWHKHAPGLDERERVQAALDSVYGVDINPFAVAIARFRLTVAALQACGLNSLEDAPAFKYHLAAGDSLLHGLDQDEFDLGASFSADKVAASFAYETENLGELRSILRNGQYDVVVGNPPYITVKDAALNALYRSMYAHCKGAYALTIPFMERFFALAKTAGEPGWVGQITSNSFMKRQFGVPLVEKFFPSKDLQLLVDTSGAYIPGHGTPTVIVVGRNTRARSTVRALLGGKGEPGQPTRAELGRVWSSIVAHADEPGWSDEWITVADVERSDLATHPWSLTGGGALDLKREIERLNKSRLTSRLADSGSGAVTREDEAYMLGGPALRRYGVAAAQRVTFVVGDDVRDWGIWHPEEALWPYSPTSLLAHADDAIQRLLWPSRVLLSRRVAYGQTQLERGLEWYEYSMFFRRRYNAAFTISWAGVASHNHFSLNRTPRVFNRWADVLVLHESVLEEEHQGIVGVLNSSTGCFWLKQNSYPKGGDPVGDEGARVSQQPWSDRYEFTGTTLQDFPLPKELPSGCGRELDRLSGELAAQTPSAVTSRGTPSRTDLDAARIKYESIRGRMIALQEELDWETYWLYGLVDEQLTFAGENLPALALGERAFEISLARRSDVGEEQTTWFERHGSRPIISVPSIWPLPYQNLVQRRIELGESHPYLRLLEKPEQKRRWSSVSWEKQEERALRSWLLNRLEASNFWFDQQGRPITKSFAVLADDVARDHEVSAVLALWEGRFDVPIATSLEKLLVTEAVPYLASMRYKDSGMRKRTAWVATWDLQRQEDAGTYNPAPKERGGDGPIPVPPKFVTGDFKKVEYWSRRGKLDIPKERFILYPNAGRDGDITPVIGWAGWSHAQQALSLATLIQIGEQQGWSDERLTPLVGGLAEVLPWVEQWHAHPDPLYGGSSPAEFFSGLLDNYMAKLGATLESLAAWRPPAPTRGRKAKS